MAKINWNINCIISSPLIMLERLKMKYDTNFIEKLSDILNAKGLSEISLKDGNQAVTVKKELQSGHMQVPMQVSYNSGHEDLKASQPSHKKGQAIVSPMVGTFYMSPSPEAEPFVEVGKTISKGDVVCIVEAMKLMNEIESEFSGKIIEICVEDGQPVEFGQVLMYVE